MPIRKIKNPRNFDRCRSCKHSYISHTDFDHKPARCQNIIDGSCRCTEFEPKDNLEFLEWKYGRKLDKKFSN